MAKTTNLGVASAFERGESVESEHMFTDGWVIYSYGYHFPIAIWVVRGAKMLWNKDSYSVTTRKHKSLLHGIYGERVELPLSEMVKAAEFVRSPLANGRLLVTPRRAPDDWYEMSEMMVEFLKRVKIPTRWVNRNVNEFCENAKHRATMESL